MVGPKDGGFGFDGAPKYSKLENADKVCVQCLAGNHTKCLEKSKQQDQCDCERCMTFG